MRVRAVGFLVALSWLTLLAVTGTASACQKCHKTPCVLTAAPAPMPAYECVTEMVPYTVYRTRMRTEFRPVTETVMVREVQTTFIERQRTICKPVYDTTYVQRSYTVCRPEFQTNLVNQTVTVCRPVTTTQQVTEYCMQPTTQMVAVPAVAARKCGLCGKPKPTCGCQLMAQTTFTPIPVVRDVAVTQIVPEVQTRQVPVTTARMVQEVKTENIPILHCRIVPEVVTERVPVMNFVCVPKTITRQVPYPVCEQVAETCFRPVQRMVPVVPPAYAPASFPTPQSYGPPASSQQARAKTLSKQS